MSTKTSKANRDDFQRLSKTAADRRRPRFLGISRSAGNLRRPAAAVAALRGTSPCNRCNSNQPRCTAACPRPSKRACRPSEGRYIAFGTNRDYQAAFDEHIAFFDELIARGASHKVIGKLLAEIGIAYPDGTALPARRQGLADAPGKTVAA